MFEKPQNSMKQKLKDMNMLQSKNKYTSMATLIFYHSAYPLYVYIIHAI